MTMDKCHLMKSWFFPGLPADSVHLWRHPDKALVWKLRFWSSPLYKNSKVGRAIAFQLQCRVRPHEGEQISVQNKKAKCRPLLIRPLFQFLWWMKYPYKNNFNGLLLAYSLYGFFSVWVIALPFLFMTFLAVPESFLFLLLPLDIWPISGWFSVWPETVPCRDLQFQHHQAFLSSSSFFELSVKATGLWDG